MNSGIRILVVDDEPGIRDLMALELGGQGYQVVTAGDGEEALEKARAEPFHLVITDIKMPRRDGIGLLAEVKRIDPDIEVIMTTGFGTIDVAVSAMKQGAYDFLEKPCQLDTMLRTIEKALENRKLKTLLSLYEASRAVFSHVHLDALLPLIAELTRKILKADDVSVLLREGDRLWLAASTGLEEDVRLQARLVLGERVAGRVAKSREPVILNGPLEKTPDFADVPSLREIRSAIVHPLVIGDEILGILCVNRTQSADLFTKQDVRYASILGSQIAQAVQNAKLVGRLEEKVHELDAANRRLTETQAQLIQAEKLATIGQLATGIAHELNNPMTSILGFAQLLQRNSSFSPEQLAQLKHIETQGQRCARIVLGLLKFNHKDTPPAQVVEVVPLIREVIELVRYDFDRHQIELREEYPQTVPSLVGDGFQIQQVLLNLITNAIAAMEGRPRKELKIQVRQEGDSIRIAVQDTGRGIPEEFRARLFQPFQTTKSPGKGTGLGLYISNEIIRQQGGTIRMDSRDGEGSTFTIELPVSRKPAKG
jgi:signal transduction histidine kinase